MRGLRGGRAVGRAGARVRPDVALLDLAGDRQHRGWVALGRYLLDPATAAIPVVVGGGGAVLARSPAPGEAGGVLAAVAILLAAGRAGGDRVPLTPRQRAVAG